MSTFALNSFSGRHLFANKNVELNVDMWSYSKILQGMRYIHSMLKYYPKFMFIYVAIT